MSLGVSSDWACEAVDGSVESESGFISDMLVVGKVICKSWRQEDGEEEKGRRGVVYGEEKKKNVGRHLYCAEDNW